MSADSGPELERRAHRFVWNLGYFARRNVFIHADDNCQITDIDVIGIQFDDTLTNRIVLIETKSEKGFSSILKLRGLLEYYSSDVAYMIRQNVTPAVMRFSERLGIRAMHTSRLEEIEKEIDISAEDWSLSFSPDFDKDFYTALRILKKAGYHNEVLLRDTFWTEQDPFRNVKLLKTTVKNLISESADAYLKFPIAILSIDLIALFSVSLLHSAGLIYALPEHQRRPFFLDRLISGKLTSREKNELVDKTYSFITKYTKTVLNAPMVIKREDFSLVPEYSDQFYNLLMRILRRPRSSRDLPRLFDIYLSGIVTGKKFGLMDLQGYLNLSKEDFGYVLKFARDIVEFVYDRKIPNFFEPLMVE